jgi:TolB protein
VFAIGFVSLFFFIRPAETPTAPTPVYLTPFVPAQFTPPPTITLTPKPTHAPGNRIAFTCTRGDYNQICMINFDGTGIAQLSDIQASNYYPVFYPQGGSLLFVSNRNGAFDLYSLSFDERQLTQLTRNVGNVVSPDYSPDGSRIVFANLTQNQSSSVWVVNSTGLNPHMIYQGLNTIVSTAWSPDGSTIAYAMSRGVVNEYEIFLMDADGRNNRQVSKGMLGIGGSIDWSPDGRYLLIYAGPVGDKDIFRIDVATGESLQLTDGGNNAAATYSPDGTYIAFNSLRNDDQADIYIMKADGSLQRRLTNNPEPDWGPQWEP